MRSRALNTSKLFFLAMIRVSYMRSFSDKLPVIKVNKFRDLKYSKYSGNVNKSSAVEQNRLKYVSQ